MNFLIQFCDCAILQNRITSPMIAVSRIYFTCKIISANIKCVCIQTNTDLYILLAIEMCSSTNGNVFISRFGQSRRRGEWVTSKLPTKSIYKTIYDAVEYWANFFTCIGENEKDREMGREEQFYWSCLLQFCQLSRIN